MFERFTDSARHVLVLAQEEARLLDHNFIGTEHLLLGLMAHGEGIASQALTSFDLDLAGVRQMAADTIGLSASGHAGSPPFTPRAKKVLALSLRNALQLGHTYISTEHLLLGLIEEGEGVGCQILVNLGIDLANLYERVIGLLADREGGGIGAEGLTHRPVVPSATQGDVDELPTRSLTGAIQSAIVACSFCGATPPESGQLVAGENAFICQGCVRQWWFRLRPGPVRFGRLSPARGLRVDVTGLRGVRPGPQPDDPERARAAIEVAFALSGNESDDGQSAPYVEKGSNLGPTLANAKANRSDIAGQEVTISVDEVVFVDTEHAAVLFSISANPQLLVHRHRGDAVVEGGRWKMARSTFCELMTMAGISCPPDDD